MLSNGVLGVKGKTAAEQRRVRPENRAITLGQLATISCVLADGAGAEGSLDTYGPVGNMARPHGPPDTNRRAAPRDPHWEPLPLDGKESP